MFISEECTFTDGNVLNNGPNIEVLIGETNNENYCARSVKAKQRAATGALWLEHNYKCFAEFGNKIIVTTNTSTHENVITRACLFAGKNVNMRMSSHTINFVLKIASI